MPVFVVTGVAGVVSMALCSVAPNLPTYALLRALVGASYGGSGLVAFVGATETMSSSFGRAFIGTVGLNVFYITGEIVAVALGAVRGWGWERGWTWWRGLTLAASGVCATACTSLTGWEKRAPTIAALFYGQRDLADLKSKYEEYVDIGG